MIALPLYLSFIGATGALMLLPGPNVSLIVAQALARGRRAALMTVGGTTTAMVVQLAFVALGLSAILTTLAPWVSLLRWIGVAYLIYLAVRMWRAPSVVDVTPDALQATFGRGFIVSLFNPKTLFFYGAFLPQFVDLAQPLAPQFMILSLTFLAIAVIVDSAWALLAAQIRPWLVARAALQKRLCAGLLAGAAAGLSLSRFGAQ